MSIYPTVYTCPVCGTRSNALLCNNKDHWPKKMKLHILFDNGKNPIPVITENDEPLPTPTELVAYFRGTQGLVDERLRHINGTPPVHNYQWLGPYPVPTDTSKLYNLISNDPDEQWTINQPFMKHNNNIVFVFPGTDEVPLNEIPKANDCRNAGQQIGYLTHLYNS